MAATPVIEIPLLIAMPKDLKIHLMCRGIIIVLLFLTGCSSLTLYETPRLRGTVVDSKGAPLEGVQISNVSQTNKSSKIIAKTDAGGNFDLMPGSEKIHPIAPGCYGGRDGHFLFEKESYAAVAIPYRITCGGGEMPFMPDAKIILKQ